MQNGRVQGKSSSTRETDKSMEVIYSVINSCLRQVEIVNLIPSQGNQTSSTGISVDVVRMIPTAGENFHVNTVRDSVS